MAGRHLAVLSVGLLLAVVALLAVPAASAVDDGGRHSARQQQQRRALTAFGFGGGPSRPATSSHTSYSRPPPNAYRPPGAAYRPPTSSSTSSSISSLFKRPTTATAAGAGAGAGFLGGAAAARPHSSMPFKMPRSHGRKPPRAGAAAAGMVPAGLARPGFIGAALVLPFAAGMLGASAASALSRSSSAYCNGADVTCYKAVCRAALQSKCPDAAAEHNMTLVAVPCANKQYSECWSTPTPEVDDGSINTVFDCVGVRRPKFGKTDVTAVCHTREGGEEEALDGSSTGTAAAAPARAANALPTAATGAAASSAASSNLQGLFTLLVLALAAVLLVL